MKRWKREKEKTRKREGEREKEWRRERDKNEEGSQSTGQLPSRAAAHGPRVAKDLKGKHYEADDVYSMQREEHMLKEKGKQGAAIERLSGHGWPRPVRFGTLSRQSRRLAAAMVEAVPVTDGGSTCVIQR